jgi:antitoxin Phd
MAIDTKWRKPALATPRNRFKKSPIAAIRNRRGEAPVKISATHAKNRLGEVLDRVMQGGVVVITRHETPKAVLLSMDEYMVLSSVRQSRLDALAADYDAMLLRMQTGKSRAAMKAAFNAAPKQLGKAAVAHARKRD